MAADAAHLQPGCAVTGALPTRAIGRTGLHVPTLGFGAAPLGNLYREVPDDQARAALAAALDAGLRYVDTAPYYGFGLSERRVGDALRGAPGTIVSTKVGRLLQPLPPSADVSGERHGFRSPLPFEPVFDYSHDGVLRAHEASLQRLGLSRVDILYVHDIGRLTHGEDHPARLAQLFDGGGLQALQRLREEGTVGAIGLGVNEIDICLEVMRRAPLDVILLAGRYTLLEQTALDTLLPRCAETGTSVVIGGPYNSGILATGAETSGVKYNYAPAPEPVRKRVRRLEQVCAAHGVPLGAAALQFVLAHPAVASVIPGLASAREVHETVARAQAPIPTALWDELKAEGLLDPRSPTPAARQEQPA
jgi:D-threo-aldose 1-dehydrogenase